MRVKKLKMDDNFLKEKSELIKQCFENNRDGRALMILRVFLKEYMSIKKAEQIAEEVRQEVIKKIKHDEQEEIKKKLIYYVESSHYMAKQPEDNLKP